MAVRPRRETNEAGGEVMCSVGDIEDDDPTGPISAEADARAVAAAFAITSAYHAARSGNPVVPSLN